MEHIKLWQGDITTLRVDAIVNAANKELKGGGGVDGAIHRAAGPQLAKASQALAPCPTGQAVITPGYKLPAQFVIHTVGPIWQGGQNGEPELLESCYLNSLRLAQQHKLTTIAFPSISTGVYGYPFAQATGIAFRAVSAWLTNTKYPLSVTFVYFSEAEYQLAKHIWANG